MKKLIDLFQLEKTAGLFGVEIEVEGRNLINLRDDKYWKSEADGSLRDGIEYVMNKPLALRYVAPVLRHLRNKLDENGAVLDFSFRTSVHVHVNVQELTIEQIINMIYTYTLLEGPLMNLCGESRKGNRFCLRVEDADGLIDNLSKIIQQGEGGFLRIPHDQMRYAAINIESLKKYGSLEFRAMQGNFDVDRISKWCAVLSRIRDYAIASDSPTDIFNQYTKLEAEGFINNVLGELAEGIVGKDTVEEIQRSFSLTIDIPFAYTAMLKHKEAEAIRNAEFRKQLIAEQEMQMARAAAPKKEGIKIGNFAAGVAGRNPAKLINIDDIAREQAAVQRFNWAAHPPVFMEINEEPEPEVRFKAPVRKRVVPGNAI